jgi:hypothetical protein
MKCLVAIGGIELDQSGLPTGLFRRNQRGAGAAERIENDLTSPRIVPDGIGDERDRLDGRVHGKLLDATTPQRVDARHLLLGMDAGITRVKPQAGDGHSLQVRRCRSGPAEAVMFVQGHLATSRLFNGLRALEFCQHGCRCSE